jgi:hypothetical protein
VSRLTVKLMREPAEPVKSTTDMAGFIAHCAATGGGWRVLHRVDVYGDTDVEHPQMADFLADWDEARPRGRAVAGAESWPRPGRSSTSSSSATDRAQVSRSRS